MFNPIIENVTLDLTLKLLFALEDFGLNPREWKILHSDCSQKVLLIHRLHNDFRLLGETDKHLWKSLQVISI